jgi:hypothetical protein
VDGPGAFFRPAAITGITPDMRVYSEEAFGPLAMIYRVPDADAAVALANSSKYGLGGMVFSEDLDEARREAGQVDTGGVGINKSRPTVSPDHEHLDREATPLRASMTDVVQVAAGDRCTLDLRPHESAKHGSRYCARWRSAGPV